jgi:hypothetical protein
MRTFIYNFEYIISLYARVDYVLGYVLYTLANGVIQIVQHSFKL